jgi:hypothetical protein
MSPNPSRVEKFRLVGARVYEQDMNVDSRPVIIAEMF